MTIHSGVHGQTCSLMNTHLLFFSFYPVPLHDQESHKVDSYLKDELLRCL